MTSTGRGTVAQAPATPREHAAPHVAVVGIGEDGWDGLRAPARRDILAADLVIGGPRHLAFLPDEVAARRRAWPSPLGPFLDRLADALREADVAALDGAGRIVLLASGSPMLHGIGASLAERGLGGRFTVHAGLSTRSLACARLGWSEAEVALVSVCGPPLESIVTELHDGARVLVLSADETTPAKVATLLCRQGFGRSTVHVLERLGGLAEAEHVLVADAWPADERFDRLNTLALDVRAEPGMRPLPRIGLPDDAFDHDGQITKRDARASALARLAPQPDQLLWDIGAGAGSIGIEWCRAAPRARAIGVERNPERAGRARANSKRLGAVRYRVIEAEMPDGLAALLADGAGRPDAIFVGGAATVPGLLDRLRAVLAPGGRLVAHGVTLETEAVLLAAHAANGGELSRLQTSHAGSVGRFTALRPAMAVMQWAWTA